jgi:hypothetical protein
LLIFVYFLRKAGILMIKESELMGFNFSVIFTEHLLRENKSKGNVRVPCNSINLSDLHQTSGN